MGREGLEPSTNGLCPFGASALTSEDSRESAPDLPKHLPGRYPSFPTVSRRRAGPLRDRRRRVSDSAAMPRHDELRRTQAVGPRTGEALPRRRRTRGRGPGASRRRGGHGGGPQDGLRPPTDRSMPRRTNSWPSCSTARDADSGFTGSRVRDANSGTGRIRSRGPLIIGPC